MMQEILDRMVETLRDPQAGMRGVLRLGLPAGARWTALGLMAVASALLVHLGLMLSPPTGPTPMDAIFASPLKTALVQIVALVTVSWLIHVIGGSFGGTGTPAGAMMVVVWLQVILIALQLVQLVALLVLPPLAVLLSLVSFGLFFWLLTNFVAALHGFSSPLKVFGGIVLTTIAVVLVMSIILSLVLGPEALSNV